MQPLINVIIMSLNFAFGFKIDAAFTKIKLTKIGDSSYVFHFLCSVILTEYVAVEQRVCVCASVCMCVCLCLCV